MAAAVFLGMENSRQGNLPSKKGKAGVDLFKRASIKANKSVLILILRLVYRSFEQLGAILSLAVFVRHTFRGNRARAGRADRNNDAKKKVSQQPDSLESGCCESAH